MVNGVRGEALGVRRKSEFGAGSDFPPHLSTFSPLTALNIGTSMTQSGPREITTPFRPIPLEVPEGMKPNEFFNSTENLNDLMHNNGLLMNEENLLLYRKALGHSNEFDTSIIYNTSQCILNPLGRPVRRTQVPDNVRHVWNRMNQIIIDYMLEQYPDPAQALVLAGEASLDATWPLTSPGVPSIRMLHNHFIVFPKDELRNAKLADPKNPNLTDGGQHSPVPGVHARRLSRVFLTRRWIWKCSSPRAMMQRALG